MAADLPPHSCAHTHSHVGKVLCHRLRHPKADHHLGPVIVGRGHRRHLRRTRVDTTGSRPALR